MDKPTDLLERIKRLQRNTTPLHKKRKVKFTKNISFVEIPKKKSKVNFSVDKTQEKEEMMKTDRILTLPRNESREPLKVKKLKKIGSGGYGVVFQVEVLNKKDMPKYFPKQKKFALKIMTDLTSNRAFEYEQKIMEEIMKEYTKKCAPHVLCYFDISKDEEGRYYLLSELMDGDIYDYMKDTKMNMNQKMKFLLNLAKQSLAGLSELSKIGLLHRDIKAENILYRKKPKGNMVFKLIDFGLSCIKDNPELECGDGIVGTSGFIDPYVLMKVYDGKKMMEEVWDETNDVYSLAVAFYEILFGEYMNKKTRIVIESKNVEDIRENLNELYQDAKKKLELLMELYPPKSKEFKLLNMILRNIQPFTKKQKIDEVINSIS
jgi:serine/threonine protein kinase